MIGLTLKDMESLVDRLWQDNALLFVEGKDGEMEPAERPAAARLLMKALEPILAQYIRETSDE